MSFLFARQYPDLMQVCKAFGLYELDEPQRFQYTPLKGLIQDGPQCGLIALAMALNSATKETVAEIFEYAKAKGFTNNGEVFSVDYMFALAEKFLNNHLHIYAGNLTNDSVVDFLLQGGLILVPYDCDRNHEPCSKLGHKAHWAILSGLIETDCDTFVIAKHGKSLNLAIWNLQELEQSNKQLVEFSPDRKRSDLIYVLPEGGLQGPNGLCGRSIFIHPK